MHDSPLEWAVTSELVSVSNSLIAGKIQGISSIRSSVARQRRPKRPSTQCLTSQFPTHPNREFFEALQGIKSGDRGSFRRDQGIPPSSAIWRSSLVTVQRAHRRWGIEGSNRLPPAARPFENLTSSIRVDPGRMAPGLAGLRVGAFWEPDDPALISLPGPAWLGGS